MSMLGYEIGGVLILVMGVYSYVQYLRMKNNDLQRQLARREIDEKVAKDNQAVSNALNNVKESDRDFNDTVAAYKRDHPDGK